MIREKQVRVIASDGSQKGIIQIEEALALAQEEGLDLVEVAPESDPPVCRIMDYGKFKYTQSKKFQESKKKQKVVQVKEVKMRPKTEEHDYQFKARHVKRFLEEGNKAKVTIMFRGREMEHSFLGENLLTRLIEDVKDIGVVEQPPKMEGRNLTMILMPKSS